MADRWTRDPLQRLCAKPKPFGRSGVQVATSSGHGVGRSNWFRSIIRSAWLSTPYAVGGSVSCRAWLVRLLFGERSDRWAPGSWSSVAFEITTCMQRRIATISTILACYGLRPRRTASRFFPNGSAAIRSGCFASKSRSRTRRPYSIEWKPGFILRGGPLGDRMERAQCGAASRTRPARSTSK